MKNISRRVFIKGLAVAGVAAAASTVLAGCNTNMIPGVGDGSDDQPETPAASDSLTLTSRVNAAHTFSMKFGDIQVGSAPFGNDTNGSVLVNVTNKLGMPVYLAPVATGALKGSATVVSKDDYLIFIEAYENGLSNSTVTLYTDSACNNVLKDKLVDEGESAFRLYVKDIDKVKNTLTVKATLKTVLNYNTTTGSEAKHAFEEMDSKTVTFNV